MTMPVSIDINCDCGESFGNWPMGADDAIMPLITTANVACGFHGGDPMVMRKTVALARDNGVAVGAHPGLPDLVGFGRRRMDISPGEAYAMVVYQVGALKAFLDAAGMMLHHVKPHGALYVMLHDQEEVAAAVAEAIRDTCPAPLLYWPAPVEMHALPRAARKLGIDVAGEIYFDLAYSDEAKLIVERKKAAKDLGEVARRLRRYLSEGVVESTSGKPIPLAAETICVHGDGPNSVEIARIIRTVLGEEGVRAEAWQAPQPGGRQRASA
jgi:UPF0271 protein